MSVEFILWDRFQIGTQKASKILKEFHHLWLEMVKVQNSVKPYRRNYGRHSLATGLNFDGKKRHIWVEVRFQRQTKTHRQLVPETSVDPNFKMPNKLFSIPDILVHYFYSFCILPFVLSHLLSNQHFSISHVEHNK